MATMNASSREPLWHLLQVSDVLDLEFGSALAESVPVLAWQPQRSLLPSIVGVGEEEESISSHVPAKLEDGGYPLRVRKLPLIRGYARPPLSAIWPTQKDVYERLLAQTPDPQNSPLICSVPYFAGVAERWPGPVVYWLTDLIAEYSSANRERVMRLDRRMCAAATLVCPNSERLRTYLIQSAACDPLKIEIVPNATRAMNLLPSAPSRPASLPGIIKNVPRPIAGVIGNLAGNMDWLLLERVIEQTPWLSWVFVGPTSMAMDDPEARRAREAVMAHSRTDFVGRQEYGDLASFARAFDVAVLPYKRCEPTYSGSSTRFYEHLAACRPMVATPGLEELTRKVPLLTLCDTAEQIIAALDTLREQGFDDGLTGRRWTESQHGTWSARARTVRDSLASRLGQESSVRTSSLRLARIAV